MKSPFHFAPAEHNWVKKAEFHLMFDTERDRWLAVIDVVKGDEIIQQVNRWSTKAGVLLDWMLRWAGDRGLETSIIETDIYRKEIPDNST